MTTPQLNPHHKNLVGRRAPALPPGLTAWLREHPQAWAGWSTNDAIDPCEARARTRRLLDAGCPPGLAAGIPAVNVAIARLRLERRDKLRRQLKRVALD